MATEVVYLTRPIVGECVQIIVDGRTARTSTVIKIQTHPEYPGWYWIDTQSGSRYGGKLNGSENHTIYAAPASPASVVFSHSTDVINQALGYAGSCLLFFGVFAPIIRIPIIGSMNILMGGVGIGLFIMALAIVSAILVIMKLNKWLRFVGVGSVLTVAGSFAYLIFVKWSALAQSTKEGKSTEGLVGVVAVQIEWGWALLFIGCILLIASAFRER